MNNAMVNRIGHREIPSVTHPGPFASTPNINLIQPTQLTVWWLIMKYHLWHLYKRINTLQLTHKSAHKEHACLSRCHHGQLV